MATHFVDLGTVVQRLSLSPRTIRKWVVDPIDPLPAYRVGGKLLFAYESEVVPCVKKHRVRQDLDQFVDETVSEMLRGSKDG